MRDESDQRANRSTPKRAGLISASTSTKSHFEPEDVALLEYFMKETKRCNETLLEDGVGGWGSKKVVGNRKEVQGRIKGKTQRKKL